MLGRTFLQLSLDLVPMMDMEMSIVWEEVEETIGEGAEAIEGHDPEKERGMGV